MSLSEQLQNMDKGKVMAIAEVIDALRVFPRLYLTAYILMLLSGHLWFMELGEPTESQLSYLKFLWLAAGGITAFYFKSGRKWPG